MKVHIYSVKAKNQPGNIWDREIKEIESNI